ncbi:MAG: helix-turn-helix transcriptional regulator, partial [Mycobacterium sp.]|nr:helix-turn-helix transcriptional regulator [Mycobacterium sp.]
MSRYASRAVVSFVLPGLRNIRRKAGMKQAEMARRLALRPETINRIEKQRQAARPGVIAAIAHEPGAAPERLTGVDPARRAREAQRTLRQLGQRQCTDCGLVKPIAAYVPINGA